MHTLKRPLPHSLLSLVDKPSGFSQNHLRAKVYKCATNLVLAKESVVKSLELLSDFEGVRPSECDKAISAIQKLQESTFGLQKLLKKPASSRGLIVPQQYQLLALIHYIDEQACEILLLVTRFRSICRESYRKTNKLQEEIQRKTKKLVQASEDVEGELRGVLGQSFVPHSSRRDGFIDVSRF